MNNTVPLWYLIDLKARVALWDFQLKIYGLKLEIPPYPSPLDPTDLVKEMQKPPYKPRRVH